MICINCKRSLDNSDCEIHGLINGIYYTCEYCRFSNIKPEYEPFKIINKGEIYDLRKMQK